LTPGVYRRAFDWRISTTERESIPNIAAAFVGLATDDWAEIFEDFLTISRKRKHNRTAMAKLQLHLLEELMVAQGAIKHYREKLDELKAEATKAQAVDERAKKDLEIVERELFFHRAHANCIRSIGDGIAWRAFGHDRAALRALSGKAVKQQVLEQGTINEIHQWSSTFDRGQGLAILNALTNWLAIGDVTVLKSDGSVEIVEVKSSDAGSSRVSRQKQKMREVTELLKNGKGVLDGENITIMRFDIAPENDLSALFSLLEEAARCGWAGKRISNCCYIEAFDFRTLGDFAKEENQVLERMKVETASWIENDDLVVDMHSLDILAFTPNCAPFSVFPFPERFCIDLLTGAKNYRSSLNLTEVGREFERQGWEVEKWPEDLLKEGAGKDTPFFRLRKDGMHPEVPPADIMRLQMETLRPQVLIRTLEAIFRLGPGAVSPQGFVVYEGEKEMWI
jgi:hypothetical protein